jgi:hypothetical protein
LPEINQDEIQLPGNLYYIGEEKYKGDFDKNMIDFKTFITKRNDQYPEEIAKINNLYTGFRQLSCLMGCSGAILLRQPGTNGRTTASDNR